jgi:hypothetical protein
MSRSSADFVEDDKPGSTKQPETSSSFLRRTLCAPSWRDGTLLSLLGLIALVSSPSRPAVRLIERFL